MMRKIIFTFWVLMLVSGFVNAQDERTPYEIALERIEQAQQSGATELDLSRLGLRELPPEIGLLADLHWLSLNENQLAALPPEIEQLSNLQLLYLSRNAFDALPPEVFHMTNLRGLYVNFNNLRELPPEIGQLANLEVLSLYWNQLTTLPPEIGKLTKLFGLMLNDNALNNLPSDIEYLTNLRELDLHNNNLSALPSELGLLTNLAVDVTGNPLTNPPPEIVEQGSSAIIDFLRGEYERREAEKRRLLLMGVSGVGLLAALMLGFRMKQRGQRKPKQKRDMVA